MYLKKQIFCISFILWKWFYLTFKVFFYSAAKESLLLGFSQDEISLYSPGCPKTHSTDQDDPEPRDSLLYLLQVYVTTIQFFLMCIDILLLDLLELELQTHVSCHMGVGN